LRLVHDLQPPNAFAIKDSGVPPIVEPYAETFAGRACHSVFDLFVGFDHRELHPDSRDLTTFQTPLGTFRLTRIPMGYPNSQQVQHGNTTFILQDEIPVEWWVHHSSDAPLSGLVSIEQACRRVARRRQNHHHPGVHSSASPRAGSHHSIW
jgi:hypothetical protein